MRCGRMVFACVLLLAGCTNEGASATTATTQVSAAEGHALLDEYFDIVRLAAQSAIAEGFLAAMAEHEARALELERAGKLDPAFRARHRRLIAVARAILTPPSDDASHRGDEDLLATFSREVGGPDAAPVDPAGGLAAFAPLITEEVVSLHMLLDGERDRDKARAKYIRQK